MKAGIIFCCFLAVAASWSVRKNDVPSDFEDLVKEQGYPVEAYDVQTEDGYILKLFRIPHGKKSSAQQTNRTAVFLMHGLMTNAESFIQGDDTKSLAFHLADEGDYDVFLGNARGTIYDTKSLAFHLADEGDYDVFLGNARGTIYGQRHTTLDPQKDEAFWRYCWDEIGSKDLPALIKKALQVSGQEKLSFIGHNEGTTSFYVLASKMPEMSEKIERHISLCPVVFLKNSENEILSTAEEHITERSWLMKNFGSNTFAPSEEVTRKAKEECMESGNDENFCKNTYFLVNGFKSDRLDKNVIKKFSSRVPSTASVREILHFAEIKKTGRFETFSNEDDNGEEYDLSNVKIPVALLYPQNDDMCNTKDVETLKEKLPKVFMNTMVDNTDNNLDLLFSQDMGEVLKKVDKALNQEIHENHLNRKRM